MMDWQTFLGSVIYLWFVTAAVAVFVGPPLLLTLLALKIAKRSKLRRRIRDAGQGGGLCPLR